MSNPNPPAKRRFNPFRYAFSIFKRYFILFLLLLILLGSLNLLLNQKYYQLKLTQKIYEKAKIKIDFDSLYVNLFTGVLSGGDLQVRFEKTGLRLGLTHFKIRISPLNLLRARLSLTSIEADKIFADLSAFHRLESTDKTEKPHVPDFLKRIELNDAHINQLFINRGSQGFFTLEDFILKTAYGGILTNAPLALTVKNIRSVSPRLAVFINTAALNGDFALDLTSDNLLDASDISGALTLSDLLLAVEKKPKPWLSNPPWDADLKPALQMYYADSVPVSKSYLFSKSLKLEAEIHESNIAIKNFEFEVDTAKLSGQMQWDKGSGEFSIGLKTDQDIPVSKLPLGQAQIRQAFSNLGFELTANGKAENLDVHNLKFDLKAVGSGNLPHPENGPITATIQGRITNRQLTTENILVKLGEGSLSGAGNINLQDMTANLRYRAQKFDLETFMRFFSTIRIPSLADAEGSVQGSLKNPRIEANVTSENAAYEFLNFGPATGKLLIENKNLKLDVTSKTDEVGISRMALSIKNVFQSSDQIVELKTEFENLKIEKVIATQNLEGFVSGDFNLKRVQNRNSGSGKATARGVKILGQDYGALTTNYTLKEKHVDLRPIQMQLFEPAILTGSEKGLQFDFDDQGFTFSGYPVPDLFVKGTFLKNQKDILQIQGEAKNQSLFFLKPFLPLDVSKSQVTGKFTSRYHIYDPLASEFEGRFTDLHFFTPDGEIALKAPATLTYKNRLVGFNAFTITHGRGEARLDGSLGLESGTNLKIAGTVDFNPLADLNPLISYVEKPISLNLTLKGETHKPQIYGEIRLSQDAIQFRKVPGDFESMTGILQFDGYKISTESLQFLYNDSWINAKGYVKTDYEFVTAADLLMHGSETPFRMSSGMDFLADFDLTLKGNGKLTVAGNLKIVEGQYSRSYGITNFVITAENETPLNDPNATSWAMLPLDTALNIDVSNSGDFLVNNNLAYLELNIDLMLLGTIRTPMLTGQVDFLNGKIHAFGVYFEEASGYAQFHKGPVIDPTINLKATTEIQTYSIIANATGTLENFKLMLDSNPTLDRKDIVSLLFYGQTSDQIVGAASNTFLQTAAITQLATVLAQPLSRVSGLDFFNVSQRQETSQESIQRIAIGKSLTERLSLAFTTDVGSEDPERAIEIDFQIFDAFFLDIAKDFGDRYRFDLNLRLEAY